VTQPSANRNKAKHRAKKDGYIDNLGSVSQNVLKFYQQLTGEERRIPFIFDDFTFAVPELLDLIHNQNITDCSDQK
jgi:hypothetical protein